MIHNASAQSEPETGRVSLFKRSGIRAGLNGLALERRTGFSEIDIVLQIFSTVEAQGANALFQVRDRDGAMTEMGRRLSWRPLSFYHLHIAENRRMQFLPAGFGCERVQ